ncbi:MAG TPA: FKBP-type peptidyl-prolyl cis-trans isomerase [Gemmatimonadaceae bacterium]|nr:FKBP-type peptidyl-prolyl cis-trans isomerase [Gemmatimonadaceae bacterium]
MTTAYRFFSLAALAMGAACSRAPAPVVATPSSIPPVAGERRAANGVDYIDVVVGRGDPIRTGQCAYVHYVGWTESGRQVDASRDSTTGPDAPPLTVPVGAKAVIAGWDAGIPGMRVGGKRRLFIPYRMGYGEAGSPPTVPRRADLVFDIELVAMGYATKAGTATGTKPTCPAWR